MHRLCLFFSLFSYQLTCGWTEKIREEIKMKKMVDINGELYRGFEFYLLSLFFKVKYWINNEQQNFSIAWTEIQMVQSLSSSIWIIRERMLVDSRHVSIYFMPIIDGRCDIICWLGNYPYLAFLDSIYRKIFCENIRRIIYGSISSLFHFIPISKPEPNFIVT